MRKKILPLMIMAMLCHQLNAQQANLTSEVTRNGYTSFAKIIKGNATKATEENKTSLLRNGQ